MIRFPVITIPILIKRALGEIFTSGDKSIILNLFMHCGVCTYVVPNSFGMFECLKRVCSFTKANIPHPATSESAWRKEKSSCESENVNC